MISQFSQDAPLVSAIVSTYNSERLLRGRLDDLLQQSIADLLEIVVVVSGSPQNEWNIVQEYQRKYVNIVCVRTSQREGVYAAWNRAVLIARGKYLANANTDDRLHPRAYEVMASALEANPDTALVFADGLLTHVENDTFTGTQSTERYENTQDHCLYDLLCYCYVGPFPMWRRSVHDEVGMFNESMRCASDYDFWIRVACKHPLLHIRETLGLFFDGDTNLSHEQDSPDEAEAVMRHARREIAPDTLFPGLKETDNRELWALGWAAKSALCISGPWYKHPDLALECLREAQKLAPGHPIIDINISVLLALYRRFDEAERYLQGHANIPAAVSNLQMLKNVRNGAGLENMAFIPVNIPIFDSARQQRLGINLDQIPPLQRTRPFTKPHRSVEMPLSK